MMNPIDLSVVLDADLIRQYNQQGPRYTSYPTAVEFHEGFTEADYCAWAKRTNEDPIPSSLSLYVHIPFCDTVCFYCACNKVVTKNHSRAGPYLQHLGLEIERQGALYDADRQVEQLHLGGGTPTFLSHKQIRELMRALREHFSLREDDIGEYSIEIDPRKADEVTVALLRELGFNRMSLGVQDFEPEVQRAVNRIQSEEETHRVIAAARSQGFKSINIDLIYGLPHQTVESFGRTLDKIIAVSPERLSIYNYAHLPEVFKTQRHINEADLPSPDEKLKILQYTIERLTGASYQYIGMDHFAKPEDELAVAQRNGTLTRNFQGYSTHAECDLVGLGVSAISKVGFCYAQNVRNLDEYYGRIDAGELAVYRGIELTDDDVLRREVIGQLICHGWLDIASIEQRFGIEFTEYFAAERDVLGTMQADGLLKMDDRAIEVLPPGRLLIRSICMVFDRYLRTHRKKRPYSNVI